MRILTNPDHAAELDGLLPPDLARLAAGELVVDSRTKAHLVHAALGLFLLLAYAVCQGHRPSARWLLLFFVLHVAANRTTLGRHGEDLHQDYYVNTLGLLVLAVALGQLLLAARRTHAGLVGLPCES